MIGGLSCGGDVVDDDWDEATPESGVPEEGQSDSYIFVN